jgi:hypothetical protein
MCIQLFILFIMNQSQALRQALYFYKRYEMKTSHTTSPHYRSTYCLIVLAIDHGEDGEGKDQVGATITYYELQSCVALPCTRGVDLLLWLLLG